MLCQAFKLLQLFNCSTEGGGIPGGTAGGLAASAVIAGTAIAALAVVVEAGVVAGATGVGWAASKVNNWFAG